MDKHSIAKGEKSVLLFNCSFIEIHCVFISAESTYKHNECAFRQMEIGYKRVYALKFIAWINKDLRIALLWYNYAVFIRCAL